MHLSKELMGVFNSDTGAKVYGPFAGATPIFPSNYDVELLFYSVKGRTGKGFGKKLITIPNAFFIRVKKHNWVVFVGKCPLVSTVRHRGFSYKA